MNNYQMGGVGTYNEMTDIGGFLIVNDARSMSNEGTRNAFHRWADKVVVIEARFLEGGGDYLIDENGERYGKPVSTQRVLAHEIGHNIFWSWHFDTQMGKKYTTGTGLFPRRYSKTNIPFYSDYLEATANVFISQIGYPPIKRWTSEKSYYNFQDYNDYLLKTLRR